MASSGAVRDMSLGAPGVLFVDDEVHVLESVALTLRNRSFRILTSESAAQALDVLQRERVAVVVSDEHMPLMGGTALLSEIRRRHPEIVRLVLSGSTSAEGISRAINQAGVFRYLLKPCAPDDLALAVDQALESFARQRSVPAPAQTLVKIDDVIGDLRVEVQPIYRADGLLFGHEALLRPSHHVGAQALLDAAVVEGRLWEVERAIRTCIAGRVSGRPAGTRLFVNLHPQALLDPQLYTSREPLAPFAQAIVLEITERESLAAVADLGDRLAALRAIGYQIAIDDMGSGYSGLNAFASILPDFVKFDRDLIHAMHRLPAKRKLVRSIATVCQELQIETIAEGIEDERDLAVAQEIGCIFMQGFLLGHPAPDYRETALDLRIRR